MPEASSRAGRWVFLMDVTYLAALLGFVAYHMWPSLFRTWFFSSDEYVIGAEVIRFVHLDLRQRFFDMPGTPFMFITALLWGAYFLQQAIVGASPFDIGAFTYPHIEQLFVLMRALTLLFFCLSVVLLYALTARLTNRFGAWAASLILATSPIYTSYSSFVRVESMSMCFMLGSLLCLVSWRQQAPTRLLWGAGMLGGLAAAARLHSMTALVPILVLFLAWRHREPMDDYPRWVKILFVWAAAGVALANLVLLVVPLFLPRSLPRATAFLGTLGWVAALGLAVLYGAYVVKATRRLLLRLLPPETVELGCAFGAGLLVGTPTILWQLPYFLQAIEAYRTSYYDFQRATWPLGLNIQWYVTSYVKEAAPGAIVPVLLMVGAILALVLRHAEILWILVGAVLFFVSKPINLHAASHHIIPWLPFYAIVAAFPIAVAWRFVRRLPFPIHLGGGAAFVASLVVLAASLAPAVERVGRNQQLTEERLRSIVQATAWVKDNAERDATVLVAYHCFNPDIVYTWFRAMAVPVPETVKDGRTWVIWWGHQRSFKGRTGYALSTRSDVVSLKTRIDDVQPGQGTDPYTDPRFKLARSFGQIRTQVDVFRFDDSAEAITPPSTIDTLGPRASHR
jgi:hypothetical protein